MRYYEDDKYNVQNTLHPEQYSFLTILEFILMLADSPEEDLRALEKYKAQMTEIPSDIRKMVEKDIEEFPTDSKYSTRFEFVDEKRKEFYGEFGYTYIPLKDFFPDLRLF